MAVSYTHLDVYKRQKLYGRGYAIGDMGHTDYVLVADDIVAVEEK